jgi:hypothetical protein
MTPPGGTRSPVTPAERACFQQLQAYTDAITYHRTRLAAPCAKCRPAGRCDDHATDADLIRAYRKIYSRLTARLQAETRAR